MDKLWYIELFGGIQLVRADEARARFATRKVSSLLAYLAYFSDRPHTREVLAEFLWPEAELEAQRNSFRVALNSLRKQLEPPGIVQGTVLLADRNTLRLNPEAFTTDVQRFEEAIRKGTRDVAISLYKAPLLAGWYDDWIDAERSRLADQFARALRQQTMQLWAAGERNQALAAARSAVHTDPLDEENQRTLIRLFARAGRPDEAKAQYSALETLLQEELGRGPAPLTRELMRNLPSADPESDEATPTIAVELPSAAAAPPVSRPTGYLPTPLTRFLGRSEERTQLQGLLVPDGQRLITLVGPGGVGKTRLALAVGTAQRELFAGRVWFFTLADAAEGASLPRLLAACLRLGLHADADPLLACEDYLREAPTLLICDNAEDRPEELAELLLHLLTACPALSCLVTSRVALALAGERVQPLGPLTVPDKEALTSEALVAYPSVALLLDRAQSVRPDFQLTARNAETIARICRRLDGWPLAIELIATWAWSLTPIQMLERLEKRFEFLVSEQRGVPDRQRSLRVILDAAFELLDESARKTLAQVCVFRGGFTREHAQAVVGELATEALPALQRQALLQVHETEHGLRFALLETVRDYIESQLTPDEILAAQQAHAATFLALAHTLRQRWNTEDIAPVLAGFDAERENLVAATSYSTPEQAAELLAATWPLWYARGFVEEGTHLLVQALERWPHNPEAWLGLGRFRAVQGQLTEALVALERSEEGFALGEPRRATVAFQSALTAQDAGDLARACASLQRFAQLQGDDPWAMAWAEQEQARLRGDEAQESDESIGLVVLKLGFVACAQGDYSAGRTLYEEALACFRQSGDTEGAQLACERLARAAQAQGDSLLAQRWRDEARSRAGLMGI